MKLTFEVNGYQITIDETEEGISVVATKDDEEVESFTLDAGDGDGDGDDYEDGEDNFDGQELPDEGEPIEGGEPEDELGAQVPQGQVQAQVGESKLHDFASFLKKK